MIRSRQRKCASEWENRNARVHHDSVESIKNNKRVKFVSISDCFIISIKGRRQRNVTGYDFDAGAMARNNRRITREIYRGKKSSNRERKKIGNLCCEKCRIVGARECEKRRPSNWR